MVNKIGGEMERKIDFFKKVVFIIIVFSIVYCNTCNSQNEVKKYYNFICQNNGQNMILSYIENCDINLKYIISSDKKNAFFIYNNVISKVPDRFINSNRKYEYSLMPNYFDSVLISKRFIYGNDNVFLILGEDPFCNGHYCTSYYLHLILLDQKIIKQNFVFEFDFDNYIFDDFYIEKKDNVYILKNRDKIIFKM
jgi:hypothetical protein